MNRLRTLDSVAALFCCIFVILGQPAQAADPAGSDVQAVWVEPGVSSSDSELEITVALESYYTGDGAIPLHFNIRSYDYIGRADMRLDVLNEHGHKVISETQVNDLITGDNPCHFHLEVSSLPLGLYSVVLDVQYQGRVGDTNYTIPIRKVSSAIMLQQLAEYGQKLDSLSQQVQSDYLKTRLNLAREAQAEAHRDASNHQWRAMSEELVYLRYVVNSAYAGLALGEIFPERNQHLAKAPLRNLRAFNGVFQNGGKTVYLFGASVENPTPQDLYRIAELGLHFVTIHISPEATRDWESFLLTFEPVFRAASETGLALAIQLGSGDLGASSSSGYYAEHLHNTLRYLAGKDTVFAVNLADNPQFNFQSAGVRSEFISLVKERYPDRIDLNRAWRSHLASYDEIEIWGDYPDHSYQNRRAFQYDWQQFHQVLGTRFLSKTFGDIRNIAPNLALAVALPNSAFSQGESRYGIDRESIAQLSDILGCTAAISPIDKHYSISYPEQAAYYTLLRSIEPEKPIVNFSNRLEFVEGMDPLWMRSFVHTSMWEGVMAGLGASSFPYSGDLFKHPDAMDALSTASLDINRLADLVHAFQRGPRDVAILFSKSSKIFDDGAPHLESAFFAYEGSSFAGYGTRFITESQIARGELSGVRVLIMPETPAVADSTFETINEYAITDGNMVRVGTPIPYNEHGFSRRGMIKHTSHTILVRGLNLPTEYLHAMDAMTEVGELPTIPRAINGFGYPIEGVKSRHIKHNGKDYLYIVNLRKEPALVELFGHFSSGRDLIRGREVSFPRTLRPLDPMLIELLSDQESVALSADKEE